MASGNAPKIAAERRHHDRAEAHLQASKIASRELKAALAFGRQREIDHHDRVLLHDPDQKDDADGRQQLKSVPVMSSAITAPTPADGKVERIVQGCT